MYAIRSYYDPHGHNLTNVNTAKLKSDFETWWGNFYVENDDKTLGRIKYDQRNLTVSEGIGYGLLISVYMSNNEKSYQAEFDKLWAYYNAFLDEYGLMNWRIEGFTGVSTQKHSTYAATDAELDAAHALIMAYYQFGDEKYKKDALSLIHKIKEFEVDDKYILKPGDAWDDYKNPSYFSYFALKLFAEFDTENTAFWNSVTDASFDEVLENQSANGVSSDWYVPGNPKDNTGTQGTLTNMSYDAIRTPWRIGLGYAWWGGSKAEAYLDKAIGHFGNNASTSISDKISYPEGNITPPSPATSTWNNATFVGGIGSIFLRSSSYSAKLTDYYTNLEGQEYAITNEYFGGALDIIYRLSLSGNFANFMKLATENRPPVITGQTTKVKVDENESFTISINDITVTDAENDALSLEIMDGTNYSVNGTEITPKKGFNGQLNIEIKVFDGTNYSAPFIFKATVGTAPVADDYGPLASVSNKQFAYFTSVGKEAPDFSKVNTFNINWDATNNGLYSFSVNFKEAPHYKECLANISQTWNTNDACTLSGITEIPNLNGSYQVHIDENGDLRFDNKNNDSYFIMHENEPNDLPTSVENKSAYKLRFYPNPAIDYITVSSAGEGQIKILNAQGLVVAESSERSINISHLSSGIYFISITNDGETLAIKKFIKK